MAEQVTYFNGEAESIAAIAMEMGLNKRGWEAAYKAAGENMGGFVGMYDLAVRAGEMLEQVRVRIRGRWGENYEWIETVDSLAKRILDFLAREKQEPSYEELERLVRLALKEGAF